MGKVFASLLALLALSTSVNAGALEIGYNEAWIGQKFQTYLTSDFNPDEVRTTLTNIKASGGSIVRLWFFQGRQGLVLTQSAPQTSSIDTTMLDNIAQVMSIAEQVGVRLYFTLFDGNSMPGGSETELRDYYYNLLNNKYGEADAFNKYALLPLLNVLSRNPGVIYGLDLMNEIEAPINNDYWTDNTAGPRAWIKSTRDFVRANAPWLRVTSSAGWSWGPRDVAQGLFSGLGLDFYDIHAYDDGGSISRAYDVCNRAAKDGVSVILGEFGQSTKTDNDELQRTSTLGFLQNAQKYCFEAALAWRFDAGENYWGFQRADGSYRPAVDVMRSFNLSN